MNQVLGTSYEIALRALLLLNEVHENDTIFTLDKITALDYIAVYAHDFGLTKSNLHGYSSYRFGEFAGRREVMRTGIKGLVLNRTVTAKHTLSGLAYEISELGMEFSENIKCNYANEYRGVLCTAMKKLTYKDENELLEMISKRAIESLREG